MSEAIENQELIALFSKFSEERIVYAAELKELIAQHEGTTGNERPLWICQNCQDRAQDIFQQSCLDPPIIAIKQI